MILSAMANTKSAKKNIRASLRKKAHNLGWKSKVKSAAKAIKDSIHTKASVETLVQKLQLLQKAADKAAKNKAIHKNKANRLKSRYAQKISALFAKASGAKKPKSRAISK